MMELNPKSLHFLLGTEKIELSLMFSVTHQQKTGYVNVASQKITLK